jgi:hypothetical protein
MLSFGIASSWADKRVDFILREVRLAREIHDKTSSMALREAAPARIF